MVQKTTNDLGTLEGPILLFGGVYSNLQALEALIQVAEDLQIPPSHCLCTGDIVGYCAQPEETVQAFRKWGARSIIGNVEEQLRSGALDCGCDFRAGSRCDGFSKQWYAYAQAQLSPASIEWMQGLPDYIRFQYAGKQVTLVHGSYNYISEFVFASSDWAIKQSSFESSDSEVIVAGHCGLPFAQVQDDLLWLNSGVIGMPANEGLTSVWYALLDDRNGQFFYQLHRLSYDHTTANRLMQERGLPPEYAKTLLTGLWDNMEILPEEEREWRGKEWQFAL